MLKSGHGILASKTKNLHVFDKRSARSVGSGTTFGMEENPWLQAKEEEAQENQVMQHGEIIVQKVSPSIIVTLCPSCLSG